MTREWLEEQLKSVTRSLVEERERSRALKAALEKAEAGFALQVTLQNTQTELEAARAELKRLDDIRTNAAHSGAASLDEARAEIFRLKNLWQESVSTGARATMQLCLAEKEVEGLLSEVARLNSEKLAETHEGPTTRVLFSTEDAVNRPVHYTSGGVECIDAIAAALTSDEFRGFCKGNVLKYTWREKHKGGEESLKKAEWYLKRLVTK